MSSSMIYTALPDRDAAALLQTSPDNLRHLVAGGTLTCNATGAVTLESLLAYLTRKPQPATGPGQPPHTPPASEA